ncbi:MAG: radical SAM protein [Pseudomonadota bacterium]
MATSPSEPGMVMASTPHVLGLTPEDLARFLRGRGMEVRPQEARRILAHRISLGRPGYPRRPRVRRVVEEACEANLRHDPLRIIERTEDPSDGFLRYLLEAPDGALFEAVRIPLERPGAFSVCLSSQVGCAMGCAFCATGRMGLTRSLEAWEMVAAFCVVRDEAPGRVSGAVFQGQGEPLLNEEAVLQAAHILGDPCGGRIRREAVSISTVGVVPAIRRYSAAGHPYRLIVSLTSAVPERREHLLPVATRWSLEELAAAVREYAEAIRDRVTVAWVVLGGVNTGRDEVEALGRLFAGVPLRINLIDVNDPRPDGFRRATEEELRWFRDGLTEVLGVPVVRRYSGGIGANAACGMLASVRQP